MAGEIGGFVGGVGQLYAAGFAASAGVNLRFDDDYGSAETLGSGAGFVFGEGDFAAGDGDTVASKDGFSLIFVNLHCGGPSAGETWSGAPVLEFMPFAKH